MNAQQEIPEEVVDYLAGEEFARWLWDCERDEKFIAEMTARADASFARLEALVEAHEHEEANRA